MKLHVVLIIILYFGVFHNVFYCYRFEPNSMTLTNYSECSDVKILVHLNQSFIKISRNKYQMNGELIFNQVIPAPIQVFIGYRLILFVLFFMVKI